MKIRATLGTLELNGRRVVEPEFGRSVVAHRLEADRSEDRRPRRVQLRGQTGFEAPGRGENHRRELARQRHVSCRRMSRSGQRVFGWAVWVLGLLLVSQLAYAGRLCVSILGAARSLEITALSSAHHANPQRDLCIASRQAVHVGALAALLPPAGTLAGADAPYYAAPISFPAVRQRSPAAPAPGVPLSLHILFGRYLS